MKIQSTYYVESSMDSQNQSLYVATEDFLFRLDFSMDEWFKRPAYPASKRTIKDEINITEDEYIELMEALAEKHLKQVVEKYKHPEKFEMFSMDEISKAFGVDIHGVGGISYGASLLQIPLNNGKYVEFRQGEDEDDHEVKIHDIKNNLNLKEETGADWEAQELLDIIPKQPETGGSGFFKIPEPNCFVCKTDDSINIYPCKPDKGGCIGAEIKHFCGDIAPFHG